MSRLRYLVALFLIVFTGNISAQTSWTLQQCIDYALTHNISIKQSELNMESNDALVTQNRATLFPTLNGFASQNYFFGRSIDPNTNIYTNQQVNSNNFSLSSGMALFEGFQLQNTLRQSKLNYLSSKYDLEKVRNDVALNVATAYLQVLYNDELKTISQDQLKASETQRDRTKSMVDVGAMAKGTLLDIESQLASDNVRFITAQAQYDQSLLTLQQLMELDSVKDFKVVKPEFPVPEMNASYSDVGAIYLTALSTQPDIKSYEYKVTSADKSLSIARGSLYPRLSLNGSVSTQFTSSKQRLQSYEIGAPNLIGYTTTQQEVYSARPTLNPVFERMPFSNQWDENLGKTVGINLNIPIFNNWSARTNIKRAKINLEVTQLNFELTKKTMYKSIQQAVQDAMAGYQKFVAGEKSVAAQQEAMNANEQKFNAGMISSYDYMIAKNNLLRAQSDLLQAKYDYIFRLKVLDFYMGRPLAF